MDGCVCAMLSNDAYPALCLAAEASAELLVSHSSSFVWAVKVCTNHISHLWSAKISSLPSRFKVRNRELELWFLHQLGDFLAFKTLQIGLSFSGLMMALTPISPNWPEVIFTLWLSFERLFESHQKILQISRKKGRFSRMWTVSLFKRRTKKFCADFFVPYVVQF